MKKLSIVVCMMAGVVMAGQDYYVMKTGNDTTGDGTQAKPFATIQRAITAINGANDCRVLVGPGEYADAPTTAGDSKNRVYIPHKLTLESLEGAAKTTIRGAHDPNGFEGMGAESVRCIMVKNNAGALIKGFTLADGASQSYNSTTQNAGADSSNDLTRNRGGGVSDSDYSSAPISFTLVDCVLTNCVGTRGGAVFGGTCVRCLFVDNKASNYGCAARQSAMYNCIMAHNRCVTSKAFSSGIGVVAYPCTMVNCTLVDSDTCAFAVASSKFCYNSIILNCAGGLYNYGGGDNKYFENCVVNTLGDGMVNCQAAGTYEVMSMITGDWRVCKGSKSMTSGSVALLENIGSAYRNVDFYGNPRTSDGVVYCGAVQAAATVARSFTVSAPQTRGVVYANDMRVVNKAQHCAEDALGEPVKLQFVAYEPEVQDLFCWQKDTSNPVFGDAENVLYVMGDVGASPLYDCRLTSKIYHVDKAKAESDEGADGSLEKPFRTLQGAVSGLVQISDRIIRVHAGIYDEGGATSCGCKARIVIADGCNARYVAVDGAENTIICGAADADYEGETYHGRGPNAVRCIVNTATGTRVFQNFTFKNGHSSFSANDSDGDAVRGGCLYNTAGATVLMDCVIRNCVASRGGVSWGGSFYRCRIYNNRITNNGLFRDATVNASLIYNNYINASAVIGQDARANQSTIVDNYTTSSAACCVADNSKASCGLVLGNMVAGYTGTVVPRKVDLLSYSVYLSGMSPFGTTNIKADPLFVDSANADWRLFTGSLACELLPVEKVVSLTDVDGVPYVFDKNGCCVAGALATLRPCVVGYSSVYEDAISPVGMMDVSQKDAITFTATRIDERSLIGFLVNGELHEADANGSYTLSVPKLGGDSNKAKGINVQAMYATNFYVDVASGLDTNNGGTWQTAIKTLASALERTTEGDTVYVAPGVYAEGEQLPTGVQMGLGSQAVTTKTRAFVPTGVRLISRDGASVTTIEGMHDTTEFADELGRGPNAMHCVLMAKNTYMRGFTLANGGADKVNAENINNDGGGVYCATDNSPIVEDCVFRNNVAVRGAGARHGSLYRCKFIGNKVAKGAIGSGARDGLYYNCFFDYNEGGTVLRSPCVYNCTIGEHNNNSGGDMVALYTVFPEGKCVNNAVAAGIVQASVAVNLALGNAARLSKNSQEYVSDVGTVQGELQFTDDGAPVLGHCVAIDAGSNADTIAKVLESDANGNQRIYNGIIDCGAVEYDWRTDFARTLRNSTDVTVTAAAEQVTLQDGVLAIASGELAATWTPKHPGGKHGLAYSVTGNGTLVVTIDGVEAARVTAADGPQNYFFNPMPASAQIAFNYTPGKNDTGSALISPFIECNATMIFIR